MRLKTNLIALNRYADKDFKQAFLLHRPFVHHHPPCPPQDSDEDEDEDDDEEEDEDEDEDDDSKLVTGAPQHDDQKAQAQKEVTAHGDDDDEEGMSKEHPLSDSSLPTIPFPHLHTCVLAMAAAVLGTVALLLVAVRAGACVRACVFFWGRRFCALFRQACSIWCVLGCSVVFLVGSGFRCL